MKKEDLFWKLGYLTAGIGIFLVDQASKSWAVKTLKNGEDVSVISNFLNFAYAENTGVAFSQLQDGGDTGRWALSALAGIAAFGVLYVFWRTPRSNDILLGALSLLFSGIIGNLTDRVRLGFVIDFIDVQFGSWHYPTFNVADAAICVGAFLLILDMFFNKKTEEKNDENITQGNNS